MDKETVEFLQGMEGRLSSQIQQVETQIQQVETKIEMKIENEVSNKISVLFDGYTQLNQKTDRIEKTVNEIAEKVNNQEVEIRVLKAIK